MTLLKLILLSCLSASAHTATVLHQNKPLLDGTPKVLSFALYRRNITSLSAVERRKLNQHRRRNKMKLFEDVNVMGNIEDLGVFYTDIQIGTPPQSFTMILDTASVVTAVPCAGCEDCDASFDRSKSSTAHPTGRRFSEGSSVSSMNGDYISDLLCIGDNCKKAEAVRFEFGCAIRMTHIFHTQMADGIMGLANTDDTVLHALNDHHRLKKDIYSLCLSYEGGIFSIGGYHTKLHRGPTVWTPNIADGPGGLYRVTVAEIGVDGHNVDASPRDLHASTGALLDSGTSYTTVPPNAFSKMRAAFDEYCSRPGKCQATSSEYDLTAVRCFKEFRDKKIMATFPTIQLKIGNRVLCFPPKQYLFHEHRNTCVGFLKDSTFVIGSNIMMDFNIIFDRTNHRIGFARAACNAGEHTECPSPTKLKPTPKPSNVGAVGASTTTIIIVVLVVLGVAVAVYVRSQSNTKSKVTPASDMGTVEAYRDDVNTKKYQDDESF